MPAARTPSPPAGDVWEASSDEGDYEEETTVHDFMEPPAPEDDPDNVSLGSDDDDANDTSVQSFDIKVDLDAASTPAPPEKEHSAPIKEYGVRWTWNPVLRDYIRWTEDGVKLSYAEYQRLASRAASQGTADQNRPKAGPSRRLTELGAPIPGAPSYQQPLGSAFQIVAKPKRFFCVGRVFKTVWFEPGGNTMPRARSDLAQWADRALPFHGERPIARFRWFIVVRRRLHHSLCFSITTFGGIRPGAKTRHSRPADLVVLHSSSVEPPRPYDEEGITRDPIAIIIEDEDQLISPIARLDCSRIYTVEDGLRVMKTGRVHPESLPLLDEYYMESIS